MPTLNRGYRYPGQGDEPDVPLRIQHLAEDVDADVEAIAVEIAAEDVTITPHVDFDVTAAGALTASRQGVIAVVSGRVFRKAGKSTNTVGYLPPKFWPKDVVHTTLSSRNLTTGTAGPNFHVYVNPADGGIGLTVLSGATWNETHAIPVNFAYRVKP